MILVYYAVMAAAGTLLTALYVFKWQKRYDVNITAYFILLPLVNIAHFLTHYEATPESALTALKFIYFGGTFMPWFVTLLVANLCKVTVNKGIRILSFLLNVLLYISVLTIGYLPVFYKSFSIERRGNIYVHYKEYGPLHSVFNAVLIIYLVASFAIIFYSYFKKSEVSKRVLFLLFVPEVVTTLCFFLNRLCTNGLEIMPFSYVFTGITTLVLVKRISLYEVSDMVIESMVESGDTGFITLDHRNRYLGSNETAKEIMPELKNLTVDHIITDVPALQKNLCHWLSHFKENEENDTNLYIKKGPSNEEDEFYIVKIAYLYDGHKKKGFRVFLSNDTQNQRFIRLLDQYNSELEEEVSQKTERLEQMHNNLILSMATMVESRDNSTGGHIRRTSVGIRFLTDAIMEEGSLGLSPSFCKNLIKAAPMHDLGKIAVDDAVLRKPGRFTPEEFEKMKAHASEGARIVHEILKDTDDKKFQAIAENVAHFHHERMDGSGYPLGLKGDQIPIEARIMAIADVYDALVSKRVYKEKMSFEEADRIIHEGMGPQFDPALLKYYEAARPRLEEYYSGQDQT